MRIEKQAIGVVLVLFILLGIIYALITPAFEASDELWHYPMIRHLADGNPLPVQVFDPELAGPWKQEASQPPLYYYLGAALTFWIDASDMDSVRWENPHVDNGIITADGNTNLVVHDPMLDPWQGTLLAIRIIRFASVLMGAVTVYFTYRIAKEVLPERPEIALGAAAAVAFNPMFLFISGAVNNDNLVIPLATLALFLMIRLVRNAGDAFVGASPDNAAVPWQSLLVLGIVIGLGALTKITAVGLLPLAFGTLFIRRWQLSDKSITSTRVSPAKRTFRGTRPGSGRRRTSSSMPSNTTGWSRMRISRVSVLDSKGNRASSVTPSSPVTERIEGESHGVGPLPRIDRTRLADADRKDVHRQGSGGTD
jgi:4-amino-4-deoxy-L-arabinose transferase-like glycosyltransferase